MGEVKTIEILDKMIDASDEEIIFEAKNLTEGGKHYHYYKDLDSPACIVLIGSRFYQFNGGSPVSLAYVFPVE